MKIRWTRLSLICGVLLAMAPASARADSFQDTVRSIIRKVGVHGDMSFRKPMDPDVTRGTSFGPSVGLSPGRSNGWKYPVSLSLISEDLHGPNGMQFGTVRSRALLAGVGYGWHFGQLAVGPDIQVGYSFNRHDMTGNASDAFDAAGPVTMDVGNSWILRPALKAEYFITPKITFRTSVDYVWMEPTVTVTTPTGVFDNQWGMSNMHARIGFAVYPFRK